jgi:predicted site-specific integrase-resolvase
VTRYRPDDYLPAGAAARRLGVSTRTLRRYTLEEKLPDVRSPGGRRIFRAGDLDALASRAGAGGTSVGYARVSSRRQQAEGDLGRQVARLREAGGDGMPVFTDVASGLSDRRPGLRRALDECMKPGVSRLLAEHPDRLSRFGTGLFEYLLSGFGVTVTYTGQAAEGEGGEQELVRDMLAIVTSFAGRLYGQRSARAKRLRAAVAAETSLFNLLCEQGPNIPV